MNFILYRAKLPRQAVLTLVPVCFGVGLVSYFDSLPAENAAVKTTSPLGVIFAFLGVFASSLYTVWIGSYHRKLEMNSMQLLFNQAPWSAFILLYVIPFVDRFPDSAHVSINRWLMVGLVRSWRPPPLPPQPPLLETGLYLLLTFSWQTVGCVRLPNQHLSVLHHRTDRSCVQHRRRPPEDLHHRRARLVRFRSTHGRLVPRWCRYRHWRYHNVRSRRLLNPLPPSEAISIFSACEPVSLT